MERASFHVHKVIVDMLKEASDGRLEVEMTKHVNLVQKCFYLVPNQTDVAAYFFKLLHYVLQNDPKNIITYLSYQNYMEEEKLSHCCRTISSKQSQQNL